MYIVKGLNPPYTRIDFIIGGFCKVFDGVIDIFSLGYMRSGFHGWWIRKNMKKFCKYMEDKYGDENVI